MNYLLGLDLGTSGLKAALIDTDGNKIAETFQQYPTMYPKESWAEQNPEVWWKRVTNAAKEMTTRANPKKIVGLGLSSIDAGVLPVDKRIIPLRSAMIWMDNRAKPQSAWIRENLEEKFVYKTCGIHWRGYDYSLYTASKILWIKENTNEIFEKTYKFIQAGDYILYRLSGEITTDFSIGSMTMLMDITEHKWSEEICERLGISVDKLPDLGPAHEIVGEISRRIEKKTGLARGTPIVRGGGDTQVSILGGGVGAYQLFDYGGTTESITLCVNKPAFDQYGILQCRCHVVPGQWAIETPAFISGGFYRWFKEQFCRNELEEAAKLGIGVYEIMDREAEKVPLGSEGIIFLPYQVAILPGVFFGIALSHRKEHLIRAVLEGCAYELRNYIEYVEGLFGKGQISEIKVLGGVAKSPLWRQMKADITKRDILLPKILDTGALGAAILAGVGTGVFKDFKEAVDKTVKIEEKLEPRKENSEVYDRYYEIYKSLRSSLSPFSMYEEGSNHLATI
jgi:xylulokinase